MNEFVRVLIGALTLGISEIVRIAQENKKCPYDYIYERKGKSGCCKHRKKCGLWPKCMEDAQSCREAHMEYEAIGTPCGE